MRHSRSSERRLAANLRPKAAALVWASACLTAACTASPGDADAESRGPARGVTRQAASTCPEPPATPLTGLIDDFSDGDLLLPQGSGLSGAWGAKDEDGNALTITFGPDPDETGSQTLRLQRTGTGWAAAFLAAPLDDGCPVDASAFTGLRLKARLTGSYRLGLPTLDTIAFDEGGRCDTRVASQNCGAHFGMPIVGLGTRSEEYDIPFSRLSQLASSSFVDFKPSEILGVELEARIGVDYDVWLDELSFVKLDECDGAATFDDALIDDFEDGDLLNHATPPGSTLGFKASSYMAEKSLCPDCVSVVPDPYGIHDQVASLTKGETLELVLGASAVGCRAMDVSEFAGVELAVRAEGPFKVVLASLDGATTERSFEGNAQWRTVRARFGSDLDPSHLDAVDVVQDIDALYDRDDLLVDDVRFFREEAPIGADCQSDADCGGLACLGASSSQTGLGGPAGGVCSLPCSTTDDCTYVRLDSVCSARLGYCVETCNPGEPVGTTLDPEKCHGRSDTTCKAGEVQATGDGEGGAPGETEVTFCQPRCSADAQCGGKLHCERTTGLCQKSRPTGLVQGEPCDPTDADPATPCDGVCDAVSATCRHPCVLAAPNGCASDDGESSALVCLPLFGSSAPGNEGLCAVPCDCSADCNGGEMCTAVTLAVPLAHGGICAVEGSPGIVLAECPNGCPSGEIRACRVKGGCLGAQHCKTDGSGYGECTCGAAPESDGASGGAGAPGDDLGLGGGGGEAGAGRADSAGRPTKSAPVRSLALDCGCSVPKRSGGRGESALLLLFGFVLRRRLVTRGRLGRTSTYVIRA